MACILKMPTSSEKGILVVTSQERLKFISKDIDLEKRIRSLKKNWLIGTHHNWHNNKFKYDDLYDFEIAGENYLLEINKKDFLQLKISAANFVNDHFGFEQSNKYWDILYVGRTVDFKKIPDFFHAIKKIYDDGVQLRILFISPSPSDTEDKHKLSKYSSEIMDLYLKTFTIEERKLFNFLTLNYDYPFPFDMETLAYFYKASRVFVYTADDEMRPRTVGYAFASGLPVVARESLSYLLPENIRKEPHIYIAKEKNTLPFLIKKAVAYSKSSLFNSTTMDISQKEFNYIFSLEKMRVFFLNHFNVDIFFNEKKTSLLDNLDIRIARHHGFGSNQNSLGWSLHSLLNYLENHSMKDMDLDAQKSDIERYILNYIQYGKIEKNFLYKDSYLNKYKNNIKKFLNGILKIS